MHAACLSLIALKMWREGRVGLSRLSISPICNAKPRLRCQYLASVFSRMPGRRSCFTALFLPWRRKWFGDARTINDGWRGMNDTGSYGRIFLGCAGWSISTAKQDRFPAEGSHLERYAAVFPAVEINSSFYRPHRAATYARWRDSVPAAFRFSAKLPRTITHQHRLRDAENELLPFLDAVHYLGSKLGCLLVQLPPSLQFVDSIARPFFENLRTLTTADIACEPRHASWFSAEVAAMFGDLSIARVVADPAIVANPSPLHYERTVYVRLHGSPEIYHSNYSDAYLDGLAMELVQHQKAGRCVWCIFDNTASGAAIGNALHVLDDLARASPSLASMQL